MTISDFIHKHNLNYKVTSNIKLYEVLKKVELDS